jgi:arabinose-5-phosphate isomerase
MHPTAEVPRTHAGEAMPTVIEAMTAGGFGVVAVVDEAERLLGVITDGDLRRALRKSTDIGGLKAADVMTKSPKVVAATALAAEALATMEKHAITSLFIVDTQSHRPIGVIHLHDLLRADIA